jgi:hypothetical protein
MSMSYADSEFLTVLIGEGHSTRSWGDTWTSYFLLWMPHIQTGKYFVVFYSTGLSVLTLPFTTSIMTE